MVTSSDTPIVDIKKVFQPKFLGQKQIVRYETKRLTAPGENYGSLMLAVDIVVKDGKTGKEAKISVVAKMVPDNKFIQEVFQSPVSFKKELEVYRTVVPTLQEFQREQGMEDTLDFFPQFFGGRLGLNGYDKFDTNAVIFLENLKLEGYVNVERTLGFDLLTSKLILRDLAKLHAVTIALKLKKPEIFQKKILPHLNSTNALSDRKIRQMMVEEVLELSAEDPEIKKHVPKLRHYGFLAEEHILSGAKPEEPWATFSHCDFWVNNILVKFNAAGKAIKTKMVDFQITEYMSAAKDLTFFLFVSIQNDIIINKYDELLNEYYSTFIDTLEKFHIDTKEFSFESLQKEMKTTVQQNTIFQCLVMLRPIFAPMDNVHNVEELSPEVFVSKREPTPLYKEKLRFIVKEFAKRNWI